MITNETKAKTSKENSALRIYEDKKIPKIILFML